MTFTPVDLVLRVAYTFKGWAEQGGENLGQAVGYFQKFVGIKPGDPWCCAFASYVGWHAFYDVSTGKSVWPLLLTGGCQALADDAQKKGALGTDPKPGMLFVLWEQSKGRFGHTGFIVAPEASRFHTLEGNSTLDGSDNGWEVADRTGPHARVFTTKDRFIDWERLIT